MVAMRVAWVTGTSGFVGGALAQRLATASWRVTKGRARYGEVPAPIPAPASVVFHVGGLAGGRRPAADFHAANCALPVALYELAARRGCAGFVFVSSAKVLGEVCPQPAGEDAPRRPLGAYAQSKALAEERLCAAHRRHGLPLAIVRAPLVYGPGARGGFRLLLRCLARGVPLPLANASGVRSVVSVTNLTDALARLAERLPARLPASAPPQDAAVWHVADGEDLSTAQLCQALARHLGRRALLWRLPSPLRAAAKRLLGEGMLTSAFAPFRLDDSALREAFDWRPPQSQEEGLREAAHSFAKASGGAVA